LIGSRRGPEDDPGFDRTEEASMDDMLELVRVLNAMEIASPASAEEDVWQRLQRGDLVTGRATRRATGLLRKSVAWFARAPRLSAGAATAIVVACVVSVLLNYGAGRGVVAGEILGSSDATLRRLLESGQVLHRVSRTAQLIGTAGHERATSATVHEWMQEQGTSRVSRRAYDAQGQLLWAMVAQQEDGYRRARFYYAPGYKGRTDGLLSVAPTAQEYRDAIERFFPSLRPALRTFFQPGFGSGIAGERGFNRSNLGWLGTATQLRDTPPPSVSAIQREDGRRVYRVQLEEPLRLWFESSRDGVLEVFLGHGTTIREIGRDDGLTLAVATTLTLEGNDQIRMTSEVIDQAVEQPPTSANNPFSLDVPPGTPVRRQSAYDELAAMAPTLMRYMKLLETTDTSK